MTRIPRSPHPVSFPRTQVRRKIHLVIFATFFNVRACSVLLLLSASILTPCTIRAAPRTINQKWRVNTQESRYALSSLDIRGQSGIQIAHDDKLYLDLTEITSLMHCFFITDASYSQVLTNNVNDWITAQTIYETESELGSKFRDMTTDPGFKSFLQAYVKRVDEIAQLCGEVEVARKKRRITQTQDEYLFYFFVKSNGQSLPIWRSDFESIKPWLERNEHVVQQMDEATLAFDQYLQTRYGFDIGKGIGEVDLPMPLGGGGSEAHYLFQVYIKDSNLSDLMKLQYRYEFLEIASNFAHAVGYPAEQFLLFFAELKGPPSAIKINKAGADMIYGAALDCLDRARKVDRKEYLTDSVNLHQMVLSALAESIKRIDSLLRFERDDMSKYSRTLTGQLLTNYLRRVSDLEILLRQLDQVKQYAEKLNTVARNALARYSSGQEEFEDLGGVQQMLLKLIYKRERPSGTPLSPCKLWEMLNNNN